MAKTIKKRFYRGKMPTIVWDAREDKPLCDFSEGHLTTSDPYTIEVLQKSGYIEIPLNATHPPEIVDPIQSGGMNDVKLQPAGLTEKGAILLEESAGSTSSLSSAVKEDYDGPAVPAPKKSSTTGPKNSPEKKRSLKRRKK